MCRGDRTQSTGTVHGARVRGESKMIGCKLVTRRQTEDFLVFCSWIIVFVGPYAADHVARLPVCQTEAPFKSNPVSTRAALYDRRGR